jgi:hypothetical protein
MPSRTPLILKKPIGVNFDADPDDITVTKRSLSRVGNYKVSEWGLSSEPDTGLFVGIRQFQRRHGLKVDGLIKPAGQTASKIGDLLSDNTPPLPRAQFAFKDIPTHAECDHLYWNIDIPTCRKIQARRGKRAAARCFHTATARYAACLHGRPFDELPPLDTWNE